MLSYHHYSYSSYRRALNRCVVCVLLASRVTAAAPPPAILIGPATNSLSVAAAGDQTTPPAQGAPNGAGAGAAAPTPITPLNLPPPQSVIVSDIAGIPTPTLPADPTLPPPLPLPASPRATVRGAAGDPSPNPASPVTPIPQTTPPAVFPTPQAPVSIPSPAPTVVAQVTSPQPLPINPTTVASQVVLPVAAATPLVVTATRPQASGNGAQPALATVFRSLATAAVNAQAPAATSTNVEQATKDSLTAAQTKTANMSRTVGITLGVIAGAVGLAIVGIYIFRKVGLRKSAAFASRLRADNRNLDTSIDAHSHYPQSPQGSLQRLTTTGAASMQSYNTDDSGLRRGDSIPSSSYYAYRGQNMDPYGAGYGRTAIS
ncbi:hypothetical protein BDZ88DRAFT_412209 [Geranomyces variabilis]|nr:hypothetical protein BDZ88DRAFT_412209 [Geranomyces variabilis]KAJ3131802.1 hypothetical protein HDU90_007710 [Geranomyces variabilis]